MSEKQLNIDHIEKKIKNQFAAPLGTLANLSAIMSILALILEVLLFTEIPGEVYFTRLGTGAFSIAILILLQIAVIKKHSIVLAHILLITIIGSFGYVTWLVPDSLLLNSLMMGFVIFIAGLILGWKIANQVFVTVFYLIVFSLTYFISREAEQLPVFLIATSVSVVLFTVISLITCLFTNKIKSDYLISTVEAESLKRKYNELFDNSVEGMFTSDLEGNIQVVNPAFLGMLGYSSIEEIKAVDLKKNIYRNPKDLELYLKLMERHGKLKNYRLIFKRKDEKEIIVRCTARSLTDDSGTTIGYEGSIQDITRQVRAEKEKERAIEELKQAKLLADDSAIRAKTESDIKTKFLSKLGHEIKTPLNSIMAFLTMIHDDLFENYKELKDFANEIQTSADLLLEIINKNIDLSKMESGKIKLDENRFNLSVEIDKAINLINSTQKEKKINIIKSYDGSIPKELIGDEKRLRQVFLNLLANAVKYTEKGDVHFSAFFEGKSATHAQILFSVKDNGPGIDEDLIPSLFNPYANETGKSGSGTGLSLAITKELVNLMGGQIDVDSSRGEGSTFTFTARFKLIEIDEKLLAKENTLEEQIETHIETERKNTNIIESDMVRIKSAEASETKKKRILLVEDNPISQNVETKILREVGYSVEAVGSGIEAIKILEAKSFDLVLMDVEMEGMDGIEATQRIRGLEGKIARIPVIAVTAHSSMKDRERCLTAGMDDYIAKPINIQFLKMTIDQWLNDNRLS